MVDLPDRGVLRYQLAFTSPQFGDVTEQDQRADPGALRPERDGAQLDDAATALHLGLARGVAAGQFDHGLVHRAARRGQFVGRLSEVMSHQVGRESQPVIRGQGVGAGVLDDAVDVEPDQPVADARRGVHVDLLAGEGKRSGGDHLREVGGGLEVGQLQPAGGADREQVGVAGDHAEDAALAAYGDGLDPHRDLLAPLRVPLPHDPALVQRGVQERPAAPGDEMADHVVLVGRGARVGPHLGHGDIAGAVAGGDPQDEVREGQVGEQLPLRDQQMEPFEVGLGQGGVLAYEVVHGGHTGERTREVNRGGPPHVVRDGAGKCPSRSMDR